tara:strand:- start:2388 stop:2621 length:234 start_codon:yes stop_codon:yes gene_type:complete
MINYFKWLFEEHKYGKIKFFLFLIGVTQCFFLTDNFYYEYYYYDMPLYPLIMGYIAMYGFTIGIALQPYLIYKDLKK